jgi:hemoglobin
MRAASLVVGLFALAVAVACGTPPWRGQTLYEDLGGQAGVARIVSNLLDRLAQDERIVALFDDTDMERFELRLNEHLCSVADGPCAYTGDDMRTTHRGLGISEAHFNALVEDLQDAMDAAGVSFAAQNRLLARLAPLHSEIVEGPR